ncbi:putative amidohydrolase YtcJ [Arthrobacter sp. JUb119]|nr:putative amidohydrolase YtcJ [Arthrobacter sp. JUb119]
MNTAPSLLLVNGTIHTLDPHERIVNAMAVRAGKIVALGEDALALRGPEMEIIDLDGATIMPGLMDVHNHHMLAGQMDLFELNVPPTLNLDEFLEAVVVWSDKLAADQWVIGGSWGSGLLSEINTPQALARLDQATGGRPALLKDDAKHNRWVNSRALELAGITGATPHPEGGEIMRDAEGRATGVLLEAGGVIVEQVRESMSPTPTWQLAEAASRGMEILHSYGITGFQDAAASLQLMQALKELDESGNLHAWVVSSMQANDFIFGTHPLGEGIIAEREQTRSTHHRPDFIKIFLDGVPPAGTGAFIEPYLEGAGFPECHCGNTTMPPEELAGWLMSTARRGISAKIHCTGDASVRLVLDTVQKVREAGLGEPKYHIAHGQFIHPDDLPRFAELGVTADISPSLWFPGVITEAMKLVLPADRASKMHPNKTLLATGALVAGGSDWPVSVSPNAWEGIYGLVTRKDPTGAFPGTLWEEEAVTLADALRIYTINCAKAMGLDDLTGSLEIGKSADFIMLSADPFEVQLEELPQITAQQTWFSGQKVYDRLGSSSVPVR